jgi:hypothetical protein
MAEAPITATIFAYQVGFGDCILLRFTYEDQSRRHLLFDFGTTGLPEHAESTQMLQIAQDIRDKVRDGDPAARLDVLVATHRHADHISGFATKNGQGSGDIIKALDPRVIVQPWTEAPEAPVDWLGPAGQDRHQAFAGRRTSLAAMQTVAGHAAAYANQNRARLPKAIADQMAFIGQDNLSNLSAIQNLQSMSGRHEYVFHGCDPKLADVVPGIEAHVLGPPTLGQTEAIRKQRSSDPDEFWQLAPKRVADATGGGGTGRLFPDAPSIPATRLFLEQRWLARRVDEANADLMLGLVRALDDQMNNTSVILLLRAGDKTLLFPGDAQIENWAYALQSDLAPLLDEVDLYKVGHHGSRNATPKSMWARFAKRGGADKAGRLTSVLSTKHGKHGTESSHTEVPRKTLVSELDAQSELFSTERLADDKLYQEIEIALR